MSPLYLTQHTTWSCIQYNLHTICRSPVNFIPGFVVPSDVTNKVTALTCICRKRELLLINCLEAASLCKVLPLPELSVQHAYPPSSSLTELLCGLEWWYALHQYLLPQFPQAGRGHVTGSGDRTGWHAFCAQIALCLSFLEHKHNGWRCSHRFMTMRTEGTG